MVQDNSAPTKLAKPKLRGLLRAQIKVNLISAFAFVFTGAALFKLFRNDVRKRKFKKFHEKYDIEAAFDDMRTKGCFQSCE